MTKALEYREVIKKFPEFTLGPVNLDLEPGTVLGFIGPNGAGKTTTIQCLVGLLRPDAGDMRVFGRPVRPNDRSWKLDIGYVGDVQVFYENWTAEKNLAFFAGFYPNWSHSLAGELVRRFEVPLDRKARSLSTGNRIKLSLVAALAHSPRLLVLDEPTAGLDPVVRSEVLDILFSLLEDGQRAIFYSTHILSDISRLADELAFIVNGRVVQRNTKEDLIDQWGRISFRMDGAFKVPEFCVQHEQDGKYHRLISCRTPETLERLQKSGAANIQHTRMTIDEISVHILKGQKHA